MARHSRVNESSIVEENEHLIFAVGTFFVAFMAALLAWGRTGPFLSSWGLQKENYRGQSIFAVSGIIVVTVQILVVLNLYWGFNDSLRGAHVVAVLMLVVVFGFLGWIDDTKAKESGGGFGGHLGSVYSDRVVTTGLLKLVGGIAVSIGAVFVADTTDGLVALIRGAAIVALSANLLNLFDRAPARSTKVSLLWFVLLVASVFIWSDSHTALQLVWAAGAVGAATGLAPSELLERHMQGDTGVNVTGALLGFSTFMVSAPVVQWVVLAVLASLNLASERMSFSEVIASNPLLSRIDEAGVRQSKA
tara:strand:- start:743 stop:1657 length:915 start_codon:yes stop_codon:yes gene_type:complete